MTCCVVDGAEETDHLAVLQCRIRRQVEMQRDERCRICSNEFAPGGRQLRPGPGVVIESVTKFRIQQRAGIGIVRAARDDLVDHPLVIGRPLRLARSLGEEWTSDEQSAASREESRTGLRRRRARIRARRPALLAREGCHLNRYCMSECLPWLSSPRIAP